MDLVRRMGGKGEYKTEGFHEKLGIVYIAKEMREIL
jgi:hypothetical protein